MTKTLSHGKPLNFGTSNAQILVNRSIISTKYLNLISKSHRILKSLLFSSFYLVRIHFRVLLFLSSRRRSLEIDMIAARGGGRAGATTMAVTGVGRRETSKDDDSRVKKGLCFV